MIYGKKHKAKHKPLDKCIESVYHAKHRNNKPKGNKMNTIMTLQVRALKTDWDVLTIGRVERAARSQKMMLKGIDGKLIVESASMETVSAAGRRYASEQGYTDAAYAAAYA